MDINKIIKEITSDINKFIDGKTMSKDSIASFIVGATMTRDDYDDVIKLEPLVGVLAEMSAAFEISTPEHIFSDQDYIPTGCNKDTRGQIYLDHFFNDIVDKFNLIKQKYNC